MDTSPASVAVVAEKPSVARDIARVLGASKQGDGYLHGNGYVVTWAIGHLVALAQPHEIRPEWRQWRRDLLPMIPESWPLVIYDKTKDQFETVRKILTSPRVGQVVCATDAGREGELIFRYIYEASGCAKPFRRLWISSLTPDAIRKGFDGLRDGHEFDPLADAARGRSRADWLVGMNLSRAYTLAMKDDLSVGRVQTPTLAMIVERELAIRAFVPEDYIEVVATFSPGDPAKYDGTWFLPERRDKENLQQSMRLPADGEEAKRIIARARSGEAKIESIEPETQRMPAPLLYDLTELQRHANRLYGFSAQATLELAQTLYEKHKLLSYPRTDSRHLSQDVAKTLPGIVRAIRGRYEDRLASGTGERPLSRRFVDDSKVTDHHAIIPTTVSPERAGLAADERKIYDLVCRRLLEAWHDDYITAVTTIITAITNPGIVDRYHTSGTEVKQIGWKVLDPVPEKKGKQEEPEPLPAGLAQGQAQKVLDAKPLRKKTRPPKRFTEATLLTAMETAGKTLDEKELSDAMKETGLGTPATRAQIIEVLLKRGYIVRDGKALSATEKGIRLIEAVHPEVKSPVMTGQWEAYLKRIQRGQAQLEPFLEGIENYVREVVGKVQVVKAMAAAAPAPEPVAAVPEPVGPGDSLDDILHRRFGFENFRPNQKAVCEALTAGCDVLLVMPTGSGKSLCYQLPAVARGGTALVISPLIALMEDQVAKLREHGFAVDRIHSGRDRAASRQTCFDYLQGKLDFLFIAPERLRVAGFPEMLAKRKPSLIAIDEAHCISQWGHDFRPDYRMIGQHLPNLRPAPVIALTATATPIVQNDIAEQLGLAAPARFIHGFRRENIAIEVVEVPQSSRKALARTLLAAEESRPAIVYVPTRKQAEELGARLEGAATYHAGLDAAHRDRVQTQFLEGRIEVMVATIAFGMGIDKPNVRTVIHTALPSSLEGYYQEIGRAGRDGLPSRAILMHAYSDRMTHDYFFNRDYPDVKVLERIFDRLGDEPLDKGTLLMMTRLEEEEFDKALEKLWIHGGAAVDFAGNATRGHDAWRQPYEAQLEHKAAQLNQILRYAETNQCRMLTLVQHFGDLADNRRRCGICDFCAPDSTVAQQRRAASAHELEIARQALAALRAGGSRSSGKLHGDLAGSSAVTRDAFEDILGAMARAGLIDVSETSFEKDGRKIDFRKVSLTQTGRTAEEFALEMKVTPQVEYAPRTRKRKKKAAATAPSAKKAAKQADGVVDRLRAWRLAEAKRRGVPAFRILTDKSLEALADAKPETARELLQVPGIGLKFVETYGSQLFRVLHG